MLTYLAIEAEPQSYARGIYLRGRTSLLIDSICEGSQICNCKISTGNRWSAKSIEQFVHGLVGTQPVFSSSHSKVSFGVIPRRARARAGMGGIVGELKRTPLAIRGKRKKGSRELVLVVDPFSGASTQKEQYVGSRARQ